MATVNARPADHVRRAPRPADRASVARLAASDRALSDVLSAHRAACAHMDSAVRALREAASSADLFEQAADHAGAGEGIPEPVQDFLRAISEAEASVLSVRSAVEEAARRAASRSLSRKVLSVMSDRLSVVSGELQKAMSSSRELSSMVERSDSADLVLPGRLYARDVVRTIHAAMANIARVARRSKAAASNSSVRSEAFE